MARFFKLRTEAVALWGIAFLALGGTASASQSWTQPAWAAEPPPKRKNSSLKDSLFNTSPFAPGSNNIAIEVGQVFLMGDLTRYTDNIGTRLHYTYGVSDMFAFDASLGFSEHSDGKYSMATLLTGLRMNLAWYDRVIPYAVLGMGFYRPTVQVTQGGSSLSPVLFGMHIGPGVDLEVTKQLYFGAGLTFHNIFGTVRDTSQGKVTIGGAFMAFLLHAGVAF